MSTMSSTADTADSWALEDQYSDCSDCQCDEGWPDDQDDALSEADTHVGRTHLWRSLARPKFRESRYEQLGNSFSCCEEPSPQPQALKRSHSFSHITHEQSEAWESLNEQSAAWERFQTIDDSLEWDSDATMSDDEFESSLRFSVGAELAEASHAEVSAEEPVTPTAMCSEQTFGFLDAGEITAAQNCVFQNYMARALEMDRAFSTVRKERGNSAPRVFGTSVQQSHQ